MEEYIPVNMIRNNLNNIPQFDVPPPFTIRTYQPGDNEAWIRIHIESDFYSTITPTLFHEQFGHDEEILSARQFYLCDGDGTAIGTASAWFTDYRGQPNGRVHWVAIVPSMQGKGLAKPLLTAVCNRLAEFGHERAFLDTASVRGPAIQLYLKFGFVPDIRNETDVKTWHSLRDEMSPGPLDSLDLDTIYPI